MDSEIAQQLGGLQADALKNFQTTDNTLSIFYVDDVVPPERVAAVIALGGDRLDNVDFVTPGSPLNRSSLLRVGSR